MALLCRTWSEAVKGEPVHSPQFVDGAVSSGANGGGQYWTGSSTHTGHKNNTVHMTFNLIHNNPDTN